MKGLGADRRKVDTWLTVIISGGVLKPQPILHTTGIIDCIFSILKLEICPCKRELLCGFRLQKNPMSQNQETMIPLPYLKYLPYQYKHKITSLHPDSVA